MHPPASECVNIQCCADNVGLSYAWNQYLAHPNRSKVCVYVCMCVNLYLAHPNRSKVGIVYFLCSGSHVCLSVCGPRCCA
jgi:hypothetical protein